MLDVVAKLTARHPDVRFPVACFKPSQHDFCESLLGQDGRGLPIDLCLGETSEIIATADCLLMVSGSVSLEVLAREKPATVMYRCSPSMFALAHLLKQCDFMSLPNLMLNRRLMPEHPIVRHSEAHVARIAADLDRWLSDPLAREGTVREMRDLAATVAQRGGIGRAVDSLLRRRKPVTRAA
jgi:lipid-A-disaccharide synthase